MDASGQQSVSGTGTVDTALSEAQTDKRGGAESDSSGAVGGSSRPHDRHSHGARSQVSTAAVSSANGGSNENARPAGSAVQRSASACGDSALSAADPDAEASFEGEHSSPPALEQPTSGQNQAGRWAQGPTATMLSAAVDVPSTHAPAELREHARSIASPAVAGSFSFPAAAQASSPAALRRGGRGPLGRAKPASIPDEEGSFAGGFDRPQTEGERSGNNGGSGACSGSRGGRGLDAAVMSSRPTTSRMVASSHKQTSWPAEAVSVCEPLPVERDMPANSGDCRSRAATPSRLHRNNGTASHAHMVLSHLQARNRGSSLDARPVSSRPMASNVVGEWPLSPHRPPPALHQGQSASHHNSAPSHNVQHPGHSAGGGVDAPRRPGSAVGSGNVNKGSNFIEQHAAEAMVADVMQDRGIECDSTQRRSHRAASGVWGHSSRAGRGSQGQRQQHHAQINADHGRHSLQDRRQTFSGSAIMDMREQPQMARIEGFHGARPRPQMASIESLWQQVGIVGAPEVVQPVHFPQQQSVLPDPVAEPQMASIECSSGPSNMVENFSAGNAEEPPEYIEESANPATSVHAAVVMDGNMSEGDTDLSSMRRYGAEGNIDCVDGNVSQLQPSQLDITAFPHVPHVGPPQCAVSHCASHASGMPSLEMQHMAEVPRPVSHMERDSLGPDIGSSHRGTGHVHPATSVHAAVMAEGTQSGEDEDLSSMRSNKNAESDLQDSVPLGPVEAGKLHQMEYHGASQCVLPSVAMVALPGLLRNGCGVSEAQAAQPPKRVGSVVSNCLLFQNNLHPSAGSGGGSPQPVCGSVAPEQDSQPPEAVKTPSGGARAMSVHHAPAPVHPATSVHATVMMDGSQSEGNTDLSSMRQAVDLAGHFPLGSLEAIGGREYSSSHVQKLDNSPTPSVAAPALATYIGDVEMGQPGSNSMSTASRDNSVIDPGGSGTLRKVEYARSPDRLMEAQEMHEMQVAPSNAEIQDMPQVNAMRSTVHSMPRAEGMPALSDAEGPQSSGGGCRAAVSGTSAPAQHFEDGGAKPLRAATATLDGSPQPPNPRRVANGGGHRSNPLPAGAVADLPARQDMRRVEADGGSGTWRGMPVQRGQGALMEGDTDMSSPPLGGSVDSMGSAGAAEACQQGSPCQTPAVAVMNDGAGPEASPSQDAAATSAALGGDFHADHLMPGWAMSVEMEAHSGGNSWEGNRSISLSRAAISANNDVEETTPRCSQADPIRFGAKHGDVQENSPCQDDVAACSNHVGKARPAYSGTSPQEPAAYGSTNGTVVAAVPASAVTTAAVHSVRSPVSSGEAAKGIGGHGDTDAQGPSAAQMAAAATAAAAAMSATAGTLLADALPPRPRSTAGRSGQATPFTHANTRNELSASLQPPMSMPSAQGHHGYASSSQRREWHAPTNGIIDEGHLNKAAPLRNIPSTHDGVHRNGYSPGYSNGYSYERKTYNNGLGARTSATSHPILPQPALTVMAPIGAVAGADSIQAYSNSPRTNSSISSCHHNANPQVGHDADGSHLPRNGKRVVENGSGPAYSHSHDMSQKRSNGSECNGGIRQSEGKRKRLSSGEQGEMHKSSITTSS